MIKIEELRKLSTSELRQRRIGLSGDMPECQQIDLVLLERADRRELWRWGINVILTVVIIFVGASKFF